MIHPPPSLPWLPTRLLLLVQLVGCTSSGKDDSAPPPGPECDPLTLTLHQAWTQEELLSALPGTADALPEHQGPGLAMGDLNQDGFVDALMSIRSAGTLVLMNDGTGQLQTTEDVSVDGGALPEANGLALADADGDGDLDLALATQDGQPHLLMLNEGDGLSWSALPLEDSLEEGITPTWADLDQDGLLDLLIPGFGHHFPDPEGRQHGLYMQQEDGQFQLERERLPTVARHGMTYIAQPMDVDLDGDLDLYMVNDLPFESQLLLNDGSGHFSDGSETCLCTQVLSAMGAAIGDPNGDGLPDFFVTGWQENRFFVNAGNGSFFDDAQGLGLVPGHPKSEVGWGARFSDLNLDGRPDLAATFGGPTLDPNDHPKIRYEQSDALWISKGSGDFTDIARKAGWSTEALGRGLFVADMDRDGLPDIVLGTHIGLEVWRTQGGCGGSLRLSLDGGPGDPHGEGARIRVEHQDGRVHYEWMQSAVSFGNGIPELYLSHTKDRPIVSLEVQWSDGHTQSTELPEAGTPLHVERD